jgi:uncharacterized membrane protein (UPF0127 family)
VILLAILMSWLPSVAHARGAMSVSPAARALPSGADITLSARIRGVRGAEVIAYEATKPYLGVEEDHTLIWHYALPAPAKQIGSAGRKGLFAAWVATSAGDRFYGFSLKGTRVASGIQGVPSGVVEAAEGGAFTPLSVVVKNPDADHRGSVPYRLIDRYGICGAGYCRTSETWRPDLARARYPVPNAVIRNRYGDVLLLKLEISDTEQEREQGLMFRTSLDPDSGMVFVWPSNVQESFWMENTFMPLTVAFLAPDGTILDLQDMAPQTEDLHAPPVPYRYAIEVNQGYFAANGVTVGDKVTLTLSPH